MLSIEKVDAKEISLADLNKAEEKKSEVTFNKVTKQMQGPSDNAVTDKEKKAATRGNGYKITEVS
jgi:hypothetical protein